MKEKQSLKAFFSSFLQVRNNGFFNTLNLQMTRTIGNARDAKGIMLRVYPCEKNINCNFFSANWHE